MALIKVRHGRVVQRFSESYPLEGPIERVPALKRGRIRFKRQFWILPGRYTLWTIARDQATERSSVKSLPLDVPDRSAGIRISELSVIRSVDPAGDAADPVEDPFRTGAMRVAPNLELPVSKAANAQISAYVTVYPGAGGGAPALTFEFVFDGKVIGRSAQLPSRTPGRISTSRRFRPTSCSGEYGLPPSHHGPRAPLQTRRAYSMTAPPLIVVFVVALVPPLRSLWLRASARQANSLAVNVRDLPAR